MSARDDLAKIILLSCAVRMKPETATHYATNILTSGWRPPAKKITTEAELAELPANSVATRNRVPYTKDVDGKWYLASQHGPAGFLAYSLLLNNNCFLVFNPKDGEA